MRGSQGRGTFCVLNIWRFNPPRFVSKYVVSSWSMNTFITAGVLFPLHLKVIPQVSIQDRSELSEFMRSGLQNKLISLESLLSVIY